MRGFIGGSFVPRLRSNQPARHFRPDRPQPSFWVTVFPVFWTSQDSAPFAREVQVLSVQNTGDPQHKELLC